MIIRRETKLNNDVKDNWCRLKELLSLGRGTSEARTEMRILRGQSDLHNTCPYCERAIVDRSPRRSEACVECASRLDRMLVMKSKILRSATLLQPDKAFDTFVSDYEALKYAPQSLGGPGRLMQIIETCKNYKKAYEALRIYMHDERKKQIASRLREERLIKLREEYVRYRPGMSEEEFNTLIESQYVQRYHQDVM